jgi:hypothetical protein
MAATTKTPDIASATPPTPVVARRNEPNPNHEAGKVLLERMQTIAQLDGTPLTGGGLSAEPAKNGKGLFDDFASGGVRIPESAELADAVHLARSGGVTMIQDTQQQAPSGSVQEIMQAAGLGNVLKTMAHVEASPSGPTAGAGVKSLPEQGRGIPA